MKKLTLIFAMLALFNLTNCNDEDVNPPESESQKAQFPNWGWLDVDHDLPSIRGYIRIYGGGPCFSNGVPVPCDPVAVTIMPCRYPNGFCLTQYVSGTPSTGGGVVVGVEQDKVGILKISLPQRELPTVEAVLNQLKEDQEVEAKNKEELAEAIVNTYSIGEDTPLSDEVVSYFKKQSEADFEKMDILAGDYEIKYDDDHTFGYIEAYVKAQ